MIGWVTRAVERWLNAVERWHTRRLLKRKYHFTDREVDAYFEALEVGHR